MDLSMESLTSAKSINRLFIIVSIIVIGFLLYLLGPILTPFLVGALLAYLVNPVVNQLVRLHISRVLSVAIIFIALFLLIVLMVLLLIPLIQNQLINLFNVMTNSVTWIQNNVLPWIIEKTDIQTSLSVDVLKNAVTEHWSNAGGAIAVIWKTVMHSGFALLEWITNLLLIPVVTFYLLRDWHEVLRNTRDLLPRNIEPTVVEIFRECDAVLSAFFRGQLLVMISLGIVYSIGLTLVGLQVGIIIGLISGLLYIVPYLGFIVGIVSASIAAFIQFGTFSSVALVWGVFLIGQALESSVLTPKLVGHRIGLHPVAVIFAVLMGGSLFGFSGVLLALPVAAVVMVCLRFINQRYRESHLYQ